MLNRPLLIAALVAVAACTHRQTVVQSGEPSPSATRTAPAKVVTAWYDTIRPLNTLSKGWNRIPGRNGTGCAHDSTFAFRVRPGLPDKVMIFLNGGGACWRTQECNPKGKPTYTMTVDSANDVSVRSGLLDVANDENPVRDYTMVFIPYCTGDVHLGTREVEYEVKGSEKTISIRHGGAANLEDVLDWVYTNIRNPRTVFVTGVSTGAIPSPVVAEKVARHYTRARVVQLGDGAGGYHTDLVTPLLAGWGAIDYLADDPAFRSVDSASFTFERMYTAAARAVPRVHFAQFNTTDDATQLYFLGLLGIKGTPLVKQLAASYDEIHEGAPSFRTYTAPGKAHTILRSNAMYTTKVDSVAFKDWLAALVNGEEVENVGDRLLDTSAAATKKPAKAPAKAPAKKPSTPKATAKPRSS
jgi:Pectinacetylesterase.